MAEEEYLSETKASESDDYEGATGRPTVGRHSKPKNPIPRKDGDAEGKIRIKREPGTGPSPVELSEVAILRTEIESLREELRRQWDQSRITYTPPIKIKEVIETIPPFDGHNISVLQFARACKRALSMLPTPTSFGTEANLTRMIKAKLMGHAYLVIEDDNLTTVDDLCEALKAAFLPNRSPNYYRGELHNLYKRPTEHVLDYISRTKDLKQAIIDTETRILGKRFTEADYTYIDHDVVECFTNGLPPELRIPLKIERCTSLVEAFRALLQINQLLERDVERVRIPSKPAQLRKTCNLCGRINHTEEECWHANRLRASTSVQQPDGVKPEPQQIICNYCKKPGHVKYNCEARRISQERAQRNLQTAGNAQGSLTYMGASQAAQMKHCLAATSAPCEPLPCCRTAPTQEPQR